MLTDQQIRTVTGQELPISKYYLDISEKNPRDAAKYCRVCGNAGTRVLQVTVTTHVRPEHWDLLSDGYWFCQAPDCPVAYFNNRTYTYFAKDEIKTRLALKESEDPRPVCYCLGVLEEHIRYEILKRGCCDSLNCIVEFTKAGTGKWCLTTNPSGKCCQEYLKNIVDKYLSMKETRIMHTQLEAVKRSLEDARRPSTRIEMKVEGMTCESCAVAVAAALEKVGGRDVKVSFKDRSAELTATSGLQPDEATKAVVDLGYDAKLQKVERS